MNEADKNRLRKSFTELMVSNGIDVKRGTAAFLAYSRWHSMAELADDDWWRCPYPGAVIEALKAYDAANTDTSSSINTIMGQP